MKRFLFLTLALMMTSMSFAQKDMCKVVVDKEGGILGHFVRETADAYIANPLDWEVTCLKSDGCRVEVWTPEQGKGIVCRKAERKGNINVRQRPDIQSPVVAKIPDKFDYPDCLYECLGKENGWYKIKIDGKVGYVREDMVDWGAFFAD